MELVCQAEEVERVATISHLLNKSSTTTECNVLIVVESLASRRAKDTFLIASKVWREMPWEEVSREDQLGVGDEFVFTM